MVVACNGFSTVSQQWNLFFVSSQTACDCRTVQKGRWSTPSFLPPPSPAPPPPLNSVAAPGGCARQPSSPSASTPSSSGKAKRAHYTWRTPSTRWCALGRPPLPPTLPPHRRCRAPRPGPYGHRAALHFPHHYTFPRPPHSFPSHCRRRVPQPANPGGHRIPRTAANCTSTPPTPDRFSLQPGHTWDSARVHAHLVARRPPHSQPPGTELATFGGPRHLCCSPSPPFVCLPPCPRQPQPKSTAWGGVKNNLIGSGEEAAMHVERQVSLFFSAVQNLSSPSFRPRASPVFRCFFSHTRRDFSSHYGVISQLSRF